ncbi:hypothetical protein FHW96_000593 [Novosphingobium sp. SG751A]|uniref:hypothetical protein n=1 Tax=Novosphingobium sp. SG751A TaxID=2587000 RepID=UPI001553B8BA|nr:hypothetical protein [Novosphingobium sp. SG751A]NOW44451.1 hypothetical protein [Novosphingobium sp. SG751A]
MTDILSSALSLSIWLCVLLASQYHWRGRVVLAVFGFLIVLKAAELISPLEIKVQSRLGRPLNIGMECATLVLIVWSLFNHAKPKPPKTN